MYCLVVDDDPLMVELASRVLRAAGHDVNGVLSAEAALRSMRTRKPKLVMLDTKMPGMDGFAMLNVLRAEPDWSDIPVIMVTGLRARADVLKAHDLGASGYVLKPFDQKQLLHRVEASLERHTAGLGSSGLVDVSPGAGAGDSNNSWLL